MINIYKITSRQKSNAKKLGVNIKPSKLKNKKIDVFNKKGKKIASIGDTRYKDYDFYRKNVGVEAANKKKSAYKKRHANNRKVRGSRGYYSDRILWS